MRHSKKRLGSKRRLGNSGDLRLSAPLRSHKVLSRSYLVLQLHLTSAGKRRTFGGSHFPFWLMLAQG